MNLSIYIKLCIANTFGKVKINQEYKHLEYMADNKLIDPIIDGTVYIGGWPMPAQSDWYTITSTGKKAMWAKGNLLVTRIISWIALIISLVSLLVSYSK